MKNNPSVPVVLRLAIAYCYYYLNCGDLAEIAFNRVI